MLLEYCLTTMLGVYVNTLAVWLVLLQAWFHKAAADISARHNRICGCLSACTGIYGIKDMNSPAIVLISYCGWSNCAVMDIEGHLGRLTQSLQQRFQGQQITEGFVYATTLFVVGPMTIIGSINAGLMKDYSILFLKSVMDGFSAAALSAAYGIGVF